MKIAIIGTGIAGNVVARRLYKEHDITVFEANDYIGGHTHTHQVELEGKTLSVDSGFIVFNHRTYPNFVRLLTELGVAEQKSAMSFSVRCDRTGLEYNGTTINSLFAQRSNLFNPRFHRLIRDILRFNKHARRLLFLQKDSLTLGDYLKLQDYSQEFIDQYLLPMGAAIWSSDPKLMYDFPAAYFVRFFDNHGMLSVNERPDWYVIKGGSNKYVRALVAPFKNKIRLRSPVQEIWRRPDKVMIKSKGAGTEYFDNVFIATHSDQGLRLLCDSTLQEREVLGAIQYQKNDAVLHTDHSLLPNKRLTWAAWNYHVPDQTTRGVTVTYNMNILQSLPLQRQVCVTLNGNQHIDPGKVIARMQYDHPIYTPDAVKAQKRQSEINGVKRTYYCGAYWRFGFHEDGVVSALNALDDFEEKTRHEELYLPRAS